MAGSDSDPVDLTCRECGETYEAGPTEPWRCACGHPLDFATRPIPQGGPPAYSDLETRRGLWTFFEFLPVSQQVTLGEGFTPLVRAPEWSAQFKLEYVLPTGSFKDRGATTTLSRARELGVDTVVEDSSGNAGAAIATYAARAGVDAEIYVPAELAQSKLVAIQRAGARPVRVEGDREAVAEACVEAVSAGAGWYASHAWNPAFLAGTMTFALELAAQRDWQLPDALVIPTGNGTLLLGAYRGFTALRDAGIVDDVPRLIAVQACGYAPIAAALGTTDATDGGSASPAGSAGSDESSGAGSDGSSGGGLGVSLGPDEDASGSNEVADGIHIRNPPRERQILAALEETGGTAVAVDEDRLELALDRLHRAGLYVEPTAAVGPAALRQLRATGELAPDADVVVPLTGSGANTV